ncbi:katanin-interacting protein-like isoform X2 [Apostichopus japonicus]|uniref:katanin-interacting protein-like isoform X2 n=1 Tax=Stichopus japonicus TaxID=307972 RepID=UPI003AB8E31B
MQGRGQRGHWSKEGYAGSIAETQATNTIAEGPDKYDEYLLQLQRKNRVLKKLKAKDDDQIELERKEQGFSLYVNGANENLKALENMKYSPRKPTTNKPKTAGDGPRRQLIGQMPKFKSDLEERAKTAPSKVQRRNWQQASVDIKTNKGSKLKVKSRTKVADYSDDFEVYDSLEEQTGHAWRETGKKDEEEGDDDSDLEDIHKNMTMILEGSDGGGSDIEVDAGEFNKESLEEEMEVGEDDEACIDEGNIHGQLLMSLEDVKNLRRSLEANAEIRHSIARKGNGRDSTSSSDDEIAEEIERPEAIDARGSDLEKCDIIPGDMIVLDFGLDQRASRRQGQNLSAKRKPDAEEFSLGASPQQMPVNRSSTDSDIILSATPTPRNSRSLSSQKKKDGTQWRQQEDDLKEIQRAMQAENSSLTSQNQDVVLQQTPSEAASRVKDDDAKFKPVAGESQQTSSPRELPTKPAASGASPREDNTPEEIPSNLMTSQNLDQYKMEMVVDKVKQMDAKSQKKLLRELERVEESTNSKKTPKKTTSVISSTPSAEELALFNTPKLAPRAKSAASLPKTASTRTSHVTLEVLSNWSHSSRVGLTEVEFYNDAGEKVNLTPSDVWVQGAKDMQGMLGNLVNGRAKTTRERNMWSCTKTPDVRLLLHFKVKQMHSEDEIPAVSKIKIWNYNKSLKDLSMGLKDVKLHCDGDQLWEGIVEKGCGNQVFDYSMMIDLPRPKDDDATHEPEVLENVKSSWGKSLPPTPEELPDALTRSKTKILEKRDIRKLDENIDEEISVEPSKERKEAPEPKASSVLPQTRREMDPTRDEESLSVTEFEGTGSSMGSDQPKLARCKTRLLKRSSENLLLPTVDDSVQIFASTRSSVESVKGQATSTSILNEDSKIVPSERHSPRNRSEVQAQEKQEQESPSSSKPEADEFNQEEMSMLQQLQNISLAKKKETPKPSWLTMEKQEESNDDEPLFGMETFPPKTSTGAVKEGVVVADDLEDERWRQQAQGRKESTDLDPFGPSGPTRRAQWRHQQQLSLEESWTSLSMFDKSQKGRLTANMNLDMQGDCLDEFLPTGNSHNDKEAGDDDDSSEEFEIPILPHGQRMKILIKTTWGDKHYVGLNGIEVFQSNGELASITEVTADPPDINVLDEYGADPRVITNLIDGVNRTRDDIHMWLAPYISGRNSLQLIFEHPVKIAMIRIWNYNKSRIHSFRGAKDIEVFLDDKCIFKGEIDRASGTREGDMEAFGDTILFSEDADILELISRHDEAYIVQTEDWFSSSMEDEFIPERPKTADEGEERPFTTARKFRKKKGETKETPKPPADSSSPEGITLIPGVDERYIPSAMDVSAATETVFSGRFLKLNFTATWGDYYYLGLTGLEVMDQHGEAIPFNLEQVDANPRDLNVLPEYGSDDRTLDKILDGENITTSDEHMWLAPFSEGADHTLTIDFQQKVQISGLRIWNYNKSPEDTYRGIKTMHVFLDNKPLSPKSGYLIRKGPGNCFFDFAQEVTFGGWKRAEPSINPALPKSIQESLRSSIVASEEPSQEYISMHMPCGFVFQFQLLCTWGDQYYVGLNGIEFFDETGNKIILTETNVAAYPPSINILEGVDDDVRTPDKLIDGINDSKDGRHTWLAPILPGVINKVYVIFDEPVTVSMIKLWNYSKTPLRGVKEFGLYLDDLLIYNGILGKVSTGARGILPTLELPAMYHTILFTDDVKLLQREKHTIIQNRSQDQDVQLTNEREVVEKHNNTKKTAASTVDQALRPKTSIVHGLRTGIRR